MIKWIWPLVIKWTEHTLFFRHMRENKLHRLHLPHESNCVVFRRIKKMSNSCWTYNFQIRTRWIMHCAWPIHLKIALESIELLATAHEVPACMFIFWLNDPFNIALNQTILLHSSFNLRNWVRKKSNVRNLIGKWQKRLRIAMARIEWNSNLWHFYCLICSLYFGENAKSDKHPFGEIAFFLFYCRLWN